MEPPQEGVPGLAEQSGESDARILADLEERARAGDDQCSRPAIAPAAGGGQNLPDSEWRAVRLLSASGAGRQDPRRVRQREPGALSGLTSRPPRRTSS